MKSLLVQNLKKSLAIIKQIYFFHNLKNLKGLQIPKNILETVLEVDLMEVKLTIQMMIVFITSTKKQKNHLRQRVQI